MRQVAEGHRRCVVVHDAFNFIFDFSTLYGWFQRDLFSVFFFTPLHENAVQIILGVYSLDCLPDLHRWNATGVVGRGLWLVDQLRVKHGSGFEPLLESLEAFIAVQLHPVFEVAIERVIKLVRIS